MHQSSVSNLSSKDIGRLPQGKTSKKVSTLTYRGRTVLRSIAPLGLVPIDNPWFECRTYLREGRTHVNIYDLGCAPAPMEPIPCPDYHTLSN